MGTIKMTGWDVLDKIVAGFPPLVMALLLVAALIAVIVLIVGFSQHGVDFIKHGFMQTAISDIMSNLATKEDIVNLNAEMGSLKTEVGSLKTEMGSLGAKIELIEINHFGHLKSYLGILNGVLLDQQIIDNETKARLDNELRGM